MVRKNNRGWIKILEAFFAIVLIMGVLLFALGKDSLGNPKSDRIYRDIDSIVKIAERNSSLRQEIISVVPPIEWTNFESGGLANVRNFILNETPNYLSCSAKICQVSDECTYPQNISTNIYTSSMNLYATSEIYSPRKLKLFCSER